MKNYNDYINENNYDIPTITEEFANKLKAEKENAPKLMGTPEEISEAVRRAMAKNADKLITATPALVRSAVEAELEVIRSKKCA